MSFAKKRVAQVSISAVVLAVLAACGGGGGGEATSGASTPAGSTVSGVAAIGSPIVGGAVTLKCASGTTFTATTSANGSYSVSGLQSADFPCAIRVENGQVNGTPYATPLHAGTYAAGNFNITPLTDLMTGLLVGAIPSTWFDSADRTALQGLDASGFNSAQTQLVNLLNDLPSKPQLPTGFNPLTSSFSPVRGDAGDDLLEIFGSALAAAGLDQTQAVTNASAGQPLTQEGFAGTAFTFPDFTTFRAGAALLNDNTYVLHVPDPVPTRTHFNSTATVDGNGNVTSVGLPLSAVTSLLSNSIAQYCKPEAGAMDPIKRSYYNYISEDWTEVTDTSELHGKVFNDYEDCKNTGTVHFLPDDSVVFTEFGQLPDAPDFGFSQALTPQGMDDVQENAITRSKVYKIQTAAGMKYAYISVTTSKSADKQSLNGNYVTMGVSIDAPI